MEEATDEKSVAAGVISLEMVAGLRRPWTEAEGFAVVDAWRSSGLQRLPFCEKHGLKFNRLAWWASKRPRRKSPPPSKTPEFREVKLAPRASGLMVKEAEAAGSMKVTLANGLRIQVGPDFDVLALERFLGVLVRAC